MLVNRKHLPNLFPPPLLSLFLMSGLVIFPFLIDFDFMIKKMNLVVLILLFVILILHIIHRKKMEKALESSQTRLSAFINHAADMVIINSRDGTILDVNEKACHTLGYERSELVGMNIKAVKADNIPDSLWDERMEKVLEGHSVIYETMHRRKHAGVIPVEVHLGLLINDGEQQIVRLVRDISKRKKSERALIRSERRLKEAHQIARLGHWEIDHTHGKLFWSDEIFRIFELDKKKFAPSYERFLDAVHPEDRNLVNTTYTDSIKKKRNYDITHRLLLPSGKVKFLQERCRHKYDSDGRIVRSIGTVHDITYVKETEIKKDQAEKQLYQIQKLEAIGTLAGGIAHDFNNILAAILGYTQLCLDQTEEDPDMKEFLNQIMSAGERARDLVKQILTFSRETEQEVLPTKIKPIIKEALKLLRPSIPATIKIQDHIFSDSIILGDPTNIHQIIMNLCTNAVHAMKEEGGILSIELKDTFIDSTLAKKYFKVNEGNYLTLIISDTGYGMKPHIRERVFEPFFTTKSETEGSGLGLSVVHGIVQTHGGDISVYSEAGFGTTFRVFFPIIQADAMGDNLWEKTVITGNEKILIVDDEKMLCDMLKKMLNSLGYDVVTRSSPKEALGLFEKDPLYFDLVITDLTMPGMKGDKLAREMLAVREDIPIIICTGFSDGVTRDIALSIGAKDLVMKPVVKHELAGIIREILDHG